MLVVSQSALEDCCHCVNWATLVAAGSPFSNLDALVELARTVWWHQTPVAGWLEAFAAHPRIGDIESLRAKYGAFADMSKGEQAAAASASEATLQELAVWNDKYQNKFGHIFIICASGRSAEEMLSAIKTRYANVPAAELQNAAVEQQKITELRMAKVFGGDAAAADRRAAPQPQLGGRSPITTHVLDTCLGRPAPGVRVALRRRAAGSADTWELVAASQTNLDGRIPDLLPAIGEVAAGVYRITFDTSEYMQRCKAAHPSFFADSPFYPSVTVCFEVGAHQTREHFHVPLTWNPYGYSTYRGS